MHHAASKVVARFTAQMSMLAHDDDCFGFIVRMFSNLFDNNDPVFLLLYLIFIEEAKKPQPPSFFPPPQISTSSE